MLNTAFLDLELLSEWRFRMGAASVSVQLLPVQLERMTVGQLKRRFWADVLERHDIPVPLDRVRLLQARRPVQERRKLAHLEQQEFVVAFGDQAGVSVADALETVRHRIRTRFRPDPRGRGRETPDFTSGRARAARAFGLPPPAASWPRAAAPWRHGRAGGRRGRWTRVRPDEDGAETLERGAPVLRLAAPLGGGDGYPGRRMDQTDRGGGLVPVLPARTSADEGRDLARAEQRLVVERQRRPCRLPALRLFRGLHPGRTSTRPAADPHGSPGTKGNRPERLSYLVADAARAPGGGVRSGPAARRARVPACSVAGR